MRTPPRSLSARRAWIEIVISAMTSQISVSLSARRAWIEIAGCWLPDHDWWSLSARRAWIEILESKQIDPSVMRRSPQGERG